MSGQLQEILGNAHDLQCYSVPAPMTLAESTPETAISVTCAELSLAITEAEQREIFARLQGLHGQRTDAQVARLESQRGLRRFGTDTSPNQITAKFDSMKTPPDA